MKPRSVGAWKKRNPCARNFCTCSGVAAGRPTTLPCFLPAAITFSMASCKRGMFLVAAQPQRERKVARADEHDVDARRRGNCVDVIHGARLFDDHDHHRRSGPRNPGSRPNRPARRTAPAPRPSLGALPWRIAARRRRLRRQLRRAGERKDHAARRPHRARAWPSRSRSPARARMAAPCRPRVASTMLRSVSSVMGECSISTHRKSKPRLAMCAATSTFAAVIGAGDDRFVPRAASS